VKKDEKTTKKKSAGKDAGGEEEGKTKLDFSNLIKHKIVELRNYCRENGSLTLSSSARQACLAHVISPRVYIVLCHRHQCQLAKQTGLC
jgi:hypothetical protein